MHGFLLGSTYSAVVPIGAPASASGASVSVAPAYPFTPPRSEKA